MDDVTFLDNIKHNPCVPNIAEFPVIYPAAKSYIKNKLAEYTKELKDIVKKEKEVEQWTIERCKDLTQLDMYVELNHILALGERPEQVRENIKRLERLQWLYSDKPKSKNYINKESVKDIPITHFLTFNRANKCKCIWHNDSHPSLHYYQKSNSVYCFSCGKGGDVIDVVQQLNGCDFNQALKILNK